MVEKRKYLGIIFECCSVYNRIYVNKDKSAYEGNCPKCYKRVSIKIGKGGTNNRFFKSF